MVCIPHDVARTRGRKMKKDGKTGREQMTAFFANLPASADRDGNLL
jgi:hypothetical protein